jgi:hypothetical protein
MTTSAARTLGAAFLSLLIAVSFLTTGAWFCADGRACMPASSLTCCCSTTHATTAASKRPACDAPLDRMCRSQQGCGCYRDLHSPAALLAHARAAISAPALVPGPVVLFPKPIPSRRSYRTVATGIGPPRFLTSPRDTRAPPAA